MFALRKWMLGVNHWKIKRVYGMFEADFKKKNVNFMHPILMHPAKIFPEFIDIRSIRPYSHHLSEYA